MMCGDKLENRGFWRTHSPLSAKSIRENYPMGKYILEVGARTVDDALAAERGGADQVELYVSPLEGALTPSAGLIKEAAKAVTTLKLYVMIRPRAGDFLYSENEFSTMQHDTEIAVEAGAHGIMCGILNDDGTLDIKRMKDIVRRSGGKRFTLHRAFDFSRDPIRTLQEAIELGCTAVLTNGYEMKKGYNGDTLMRLMDAAKDRIEIMLALGSTFNTASELETAMKETGATHYHIVNGYRRRVSGMRYADGGDTSTSDHLKNTVFKIEYLEKKAVREVRDIFDTYEF